MTKRSNVETQKNMLCRLGTDIHKIKEINRVKKLKPDTKNLCWAGGQPRVEKLCKKSKQKYE